MRVAVKTAVRRRKGVSLVEAMILILVLALTMGAMFATMAWASRTHAFGRQGTESRQVLFAWLQTFESVWPPNNLWPPFDPNDPVPAPPPPGTIIQRADEQIVIVGNMLGTWDAPSGRALIGSYTVQAVPAAQAGDGLMTLAITVRAGNRELVTLNRSFNIFSSDAVMDVVP